MVPAKLIAESTLFKGLSREQMERVRGLVVETSYPSGATLFREGDVAAHLYIVLQGSVNLTMRAPLWRSDLKLETIIMVLRRGDTFGWSALVEPHILTLSAYTVGLCRLALIDGQLLRRLLEEDPVMGHRVMRSAASLVGARLASISKTLMSERSKDLAASKIPI